MRRAIVGMLADLMAEIKASFAALEVKLDNIQSVVSEHGQRIDSLESNANLQDQHISKLEEMFEALAESNAKLMAKAIDLEVRNRRNNLRIIGLPESIEGPGPTDFFSKLLIELQGEQTVVSLLELDRAHRVPVTRLQNGARLQPMIIRLHCFQIKDQIIREARKRRGSIPWVCCTDF